MKFTHIKLENWKNFKFIDQSLQERVFLIGPNASGKTNFLDVFRFLKEICDPVGGGFQQAVASRMGMTHLRSLLARENPDVTIEFKIEDVDGEKWSYRLVFGQQKREPLPTIREERIEGPDLSPISRPEEAEKNDPEQMQQTLLENKSRNQNWRPLSAFFNSIQYCHVIPSLIRAPRSTENKIRDPFGSDFLGIMADIPVKEQNRRIKQIVKTLKAVVPQIQNLELKKDKRGIPHLHAKYQHWRPQGAWQDERDLSDGTLRLLGFLWALEGDGGPLLLEEPEHSLHVEVVRLLPQLFARVQNASNRQIFISTHSPDLLNDKGVSPEEVLYLETTSNGTEIKSAALEKIIVSLFESGMPLGEAATPFTKPPNAEQLLISF